MGNDFKLEMLHLCKQISRHKPAVDSGTIDGLALTMLDLDRSGYLDCCKEVSSLDEDPEESEKKLSNLGEIIKWPLIFSTSIFMLPISSLISSPLFFRLD